MQNDSSSTRVPRVGHSNSTYPPLVRYFSDGGWILGIPVEALALLFLCTNAIGAAFFLSVAAAACFWLSWYTSAVADQIDQLSEHQSPVTN